MTSPNDSARRLRQTQPAICLLVVLLAAFSTGACGESKSNPTSPSTGFATDASQAGPCEASVSDGPGPGSDRSGPYYHQVAVATTNDGLSLSEPRRVLNHASVPDGVLFQGSVLVYYVNGETGSVWVARLTGNSATPIGPISLDGTLNPAGVVDPDAILSQTGAVRLVYLSGFGSPNTTRTRAMCMAESVDGVNFEVLGPALASVTSVETDPSIVRLPNGSWLMATSRGQETVLARSTGGLIFSTYDTVSFGGVPELAVSNDGQLRLYVCATPGIVAYTSVDDGSSWRTNGVIVPSGTLGSGIVCDPSLVAGAGLFLFKTAS